MDIFWPPDLPQAPQVSNYKHATANNTVSFKAEYGPPMVRRRTSANLSRRTWTFLLNRKWKRCDGEMIDQFQLFIDFMEVAEGFSFWFPDPTNPKQDIKVRFVAASGETGQEVTPASREFWSVTVNVEVWPHAVRVRA